MVLTGGHLPIPVVIMVKWMWCSHWSQLDHMFPLGVDSPIQAPQLGKDGSPNENHSYQEQGHGMQCWYKEQAAATEARFTAVWHSYPGPGP